MLKASLAAQRPAPIDRRSEERSHIVCPATVIVLHGNNPHIDGAIRNVSGRGLQLELSEKVVPTSLVKVEFYDDFILGEVVYCLEQGPKWIVGVLAEHALFGLAALDESVRDLRS